MLVEKRRVLGEIQTPIDIYKKNFHVNNSFGPGAQYLRAGVFVL